jgi:hypothetical protein
MEMAIQLEELVPHEFPAVTHTFPEEVPKLTVIEFVP